MKGWMYILQCSNGSYYTGSTNDLEKRLEEHQNGKGANFTKKHLPIELVYVEEFDRIDKAFYREKQIQGWSRKKKEALINGQMYKLPELASCKNETHFSNAVASVRLSDSGFDSAQPPEGGSTSATLSASRSVTGNTDPEHGKRVNTLLIEHV
jgi:putative endonuclease